MVQVTNFESGLTTYLSIEMAIYQLKKDYPIEFILNAISRGCLISTLYADYLPIKSKP